MHGAKCDVSVDALCDDGLFILGGVLELEKLSGAQGKDHGLVVFLQLVVDLGKYERSEIAVAEALIFEKGFSVSVMLA